MIFSLIILENKLSLDNYRIIEFDEKEDYDNYDHILKLNENICPFREDLRYFVCFGSNYINFIFGINIDKMDDDHKIIRFYPGLNNNKNHKIQLNDVECIKIATKFIIRKFNIRFIFSIFNKKYKDLENSFINAKYIYDIDETKNDRRFHKISEDEHVLIYYNNSYFG
jgi:hypothetical protein